MKRKKWLSMMKKSFTFFVFFLVLTSPHVLLCQEPPLSGPAVGVIETLNITLLDCMKRGDELGYSGRYALLEPVLNRSFYFLYMIVKSSGSYWKNLGVNNQKQLLEKYTAWSVATYASRFKKYKGQQFIVVSSKPFRKKYMKVVSHIVKNNDKIRKFTYLLAKNKGSWFIVDIQVEGVSQLSLTRAQFKSVLKDKGIEGLLKVLDEKTAILQQEKNS